MVRAARVLHNSAPRVTPSAGAMTGAAESIEDLAKSVRLLAETTQRGLESVWAALADLSDVLRLTLVRDIREAYVAEPWTMILCDPSAGAFTITIPKAADNEGALIVIVNQSASTNVITAAFHPDDTCKDAATSTLTSAWQVLRLIADSRNDEWVAW